MPSADFNEDAKPNSLVNEASDKSRIKGFDVVKAFACVCVVFAHCGLPGRAYTFMQWIRWDVLFFFVVSGYFFHREDVGYALDKAKHILKITLYATLFYVIFEILLHCAQNDLLAYVREEFTVINIGAFVVFNSPLFVNGHLWYLYALLYVYLAQALIIKLGLSKYELPIGIVLLVLHYFLKYGLYLLGHPIENGFYRNFLFTGLPFFFMGKLFYRKGQGWIAKIHPSPTVWCWVLVVGGAFLAVAEYCVLGRAFPAYIGCVVILIGLMIGILNKNFERFPEAIAKFGRDDSMMIYILHPAVYLTMDCVLSSLTGNYIYRWIRPFVTVILTFFLSRAFTYCKNSVLARLKKG